MSLRPSTDHVQDSECPACGGEGGYPRTVMVCCGVPNFDGSCCGMGKPEAMLDQCEMCGGKGTIQA